MPILKDKDAASLGGMRQLGIVVSSWAGLEEPGMERLYVELTAVALQAKDGKADLSKIQLESVIVWVVKQKFPPATPAAQQ
jgi:hypothetical protein